MLREDLFIGAQAAMWEQAAIELNAGQKRTHWIWFVFPQLKGLGQSETSRLFALSELDAEEYMAHPLLSERLVYATERLLWHRVDHDLPTERVLGEVDFAKFRSSMTLFYLVTGRDAFGRALRACCHEQMCPFTTRALKQT